MGHLRLLGGFNVPHFFLAIKVVILIPSMTAFTRDEFM